VQFVGRALDVVRVPGKRDAKLAEAKEHLASAVTLHEAMLEVHPSTVASVVGEIVTVGQQVAVDLEQVQVSCSCPSNLNHTMYTKQPHLCAECKWKYVGLRRNYSPHMNGRRGSRKRRNGRWHV